MQRLRTGMKWKDLVLNPGLQRQVDDIGLWLQHHKDLMKDGNFSRRVKPGFIVLFVGPSGTGKSLTVGLLGKRFKKNVYRIGLGSVVSKYITETEKNLSRIFDKAEKKDWILFFDEADALFGKRTNIENGGDRYANQELLSFFFQKLENYRGLSIVSLTQNDIPQSESFNHFDSIIDFPLPGINERLTLWKSSLPSDLKVDPDLDWQHISEAYPMTGAEIVHVIQYASLKALSRKQKRIVLQDILEGVNKVGVRNDEEYSVRG